MPRVDVPEPVKGQQASELSTSRGLPPCPGRNQCSEFSLAVSTGQCNACRDAMNFCLSSLRDKADVKIQLYK